MLSIEVQRRILAIVLESIKMEDPEYIDDVASRITRTTCNLIEKQKRFPEKEEFLRRCSQIATKFFKFNKIDRDSFFDDLYERLLFSEIELDIAINEQTLDWSLILAEIGLAEETEQKILIELRSLRKEYTESISYIMKCLLGMKTKMAVNESQLKDIRLKFESLVMLLKITEKEQKGLINRLKGWGSEVGLGVIGNFLYDILKLISSGG